MIELNVYLNSSHHEICYFKSISLGRFSSGSVDKTPFIGFWTDSAGQERSQNGGKPWIYKQKQITAAAILDEQNGNNNHEYESLKQPGIFENSCWHGLFLVCLHVLWICNYVYTPVYDAFWILFMNMGTL